MWQQKILYEGNAYGVFRYDAFLLYMTKKGVHIPYRDTPIDRTDIFIVEPATTVTYTARKRIVPRALDIWSVKVTLSGHRIEEVEKNLSALVF